MRRVTRALPSFILEECGFHSRQAAVSNQLDTQEVVPTTVVDAVDEVNQAIEEDQVFSRVPQSDTETVPVVVPARIQMMVVTLLSKIGSTPFWEKWLRVSKRSWPVQPQAQHHQPRRC